MRVKGVYRGTVHSIVYRGFVGHVWGLTYCTRATLTSLRGFFARMILQGSGFRVKGAESLV